MISPRRLPPGLEAEITAWVSDSAPLAPSVSIGIFDRDGLVFHLGLGASRRGGPPPDPSTVYRIASMSKSFCAATVLILAERGLLSLEDTVSTYVPEFPDYVDEQGARTEVTLQMLLSNSAGLPEDNAWADFYVGADEAFLRGVLTDGVSFSEEPGMSYQYSNLGFATLGLVVEAVTGRGFTEVAMTELIEPLGLSHTRYDWRDYGQEQVEFELARGYESFDGGETWLDRPYVDTGMMACAGSLYSDIHDIARWSAWLSSAFDAGVDDDEILSGRSRRLLQRAWTPIHSMEPRMSRPELDGIGYGFGAIVESHTRFGRIVQHSGGLPGFGSNMRWHCSSGIGIVTYTNTNGLAPAAWNAHLLDMVLERLAVPARIVPLWPETLAAAVAIDTAIVATQSVDPALGLFSPNVVSDMPFEERNRRLGAAIEAVGGLREMTSPLESRLRSSVSAAQACWTIPGNDGDLLCTVELTPTAARAVQRLQIDSDPVARDEPPLVVHHYRPQVPG